MAGPTVRAARNEVEGRPAGGTRPGAPGEAREADRRQPPAKRRGPAGSPTAKHGETQGPKRPGPRQGPHKHKRQPAPDNGTRPKGATPKGGRGLGGGATEAQTRPRGRNKGGGKLPEFRRQPADW